MYVKYLPDGIHGHFYGDIVTNNWFSIHKKRPYVSFSNDRQFGRAFF